MCSQAHFPKLETDYGSSPEINDLQRPIFLDLNNRTN